MAKDAGVVRKVKNIVLVNTEKVDAFIESFSKEAYWLWEKLLRLLIKKVELERQLHALI